MATVHVELSRADVRADTGATLPTLKSKAVRAETLTSTATSAPGTLVARAGEIWSVTAIDGAIWIDFGTTPDAGVTNIRRIVLQGQTRDFGAAAGDKIAIRSF